MKTENFEPIYPRPYPADVCFLLFLFVDHKKSFKDAKRERSRCCVCEKTPHNSMFFMKKTRVENGNFTHIFHVVVVFFNEFSFFALKKNSAKDFSWGVIFFVDGFFSRILNYSKWFIRKIQSWSRKKSMVSHKTRRLKHVGWHDNNWKQLELNSKK